MFTQIENVRLSGLRMLSSPFMRSGRAARLLILIYHRVLPEQDPMRQGEPDAHEFERQMALLANHFNVLPLVDAVERLQSGRLPRRSACVTFDDGYADNAEIALPILQRWGIPATFFISTAFLDGGRMWNDTVIESVRRASGPELDLGSIGLGCYTIENWSQRRQAVSQLLSTLKYLPLDERLERVAQVADSASAALPERMMMSSGQVKALSNAGMDIGGHTVNHPILTSIGNEAARREIGQGKEELAGITGLPVRVFAYPNGKPGQDYQREHIDIVRSLGFEAAVSTSWGVARQTTDPYQLPRFTPWDRKPERFMLRLMQNTLMNKTITV
jgi:peptidoglycan/xylan/chitin deacetylase (PgdA/CDA1 family)